MKCSPFIRHHLSPLEPPRCLAPAHGLVLVLPYVGTTLARS
jgi:hypothetical protein